jgi:hypothetical protein
MKIFGANLCLNGCCRHQIAAGRAAAMPGRAHGIAGLAGGGAAGLLQEKGRGRAGLQQEPRQAVKVARPQAQRAETKVRALPKIIS